MKRYEYILFDVAGTLLNKPTLYSTLLKVLSDYKYNVKEQELKGKHKFLSEIIHFPDNTNEEFYNEFNTELLYALGVLPTKALLKDIFKSCSYLPWEKYSDTQVLTKIATPIGVISNFNTTLKSKLDIFFGTVFADILVSAELGVAKPNIEFYKRTLDHIKIDPKKILYIGDSVKLDIEPAISLGIDSLLIDRDNLYPSSKYRINSLTDILRYINE